jgi:NADPH-dependent 2,4-dienoyl-CoA reductase/sulfur reductase-like enzyme
MNQITPVQILQQIAQIQHMEPGKLCVIGQGPTGPYYNLQCREEGKTLTVYVPADQVPLVTEHTANYRQFQALVHQYARLIIDRTRAQRASGSKKKTPRRSSSWPKTRKSGS